MAVSLTFEDDGAPELTDTPGSLMAVLRWALPQLGWSEEYVDEARNRAAFRNDVMQGATGRYLEIVDDPIEHAGDTAEHAQFYGYASMAGIDDGIGRFPANAWVAKRFDHISSPVEWRIIGDARSFWLLIQAEGISGGGPRPVAHYFGDCIAFNAADTSLFAIGAATFRAGTTSEEGFLRNLSSVSSLTASSDHLDLTYDQPLGIATPRRDGPGTGDKMSGCIGDTYTENITGGLTNTPILVTQNSGYRGLLRGLIGLLVNVDGVDTETALFKGLVIEDVATYWGNRDVELLTIGTRHRNSVFGGGKQIFGVIEGEWP